MQKYQNNIQNQFGDGITGAMIEVRDVVGGALSTLFSDDGVTALGNPFLAQDLSEFFFYAANSRYDITISGPVTDSISDIILFDPADAPGGGVQISGVPANNQIAVWTDATTIEGESQLTYNGNLLLHAASQAQITIDETDGGGGCILLLTSTSTGANGVRLFFDSSSGTAAHIQQTSDSGTLQDTWISMFANGAVSLFFNGQNALRTSNNIGSDVGMGAEVFSAAGNFEPVGMNVLPPNLQNAAFMFGVGTPGDMIFHDEVTARVYTLNNISGTKEGVMWSVINDAGAGDLTFQAGAGVIITYWNGAAWATTAVAGSVVAGEGQFTIYKRTDTEYYLSGPNLV